MISTVPWLTPGRGGVGLSSDTIIAGQRGRHTGRSIRGRRGAAHARSRAWRAGCSRSRRPRSPWKAARSRSWPSPECVSEEREEQDGKRPLPPPLTGCGTLLPKGAMNNAYEAQVSPTARTSTQWPTTAPWSSTLATPQPARSPHRLRNGRAKLARTKVSLKSPRDNNPAAIAIGPDGKSAYVVTQGNNNLVEFSRDPETGLLSEIGCISREDAECAAHEAKGLNKPYGVAVSPDGKNVYVASYTDEAWRSYPQYRNRRLGTVGPRQMTASPAPSADAVDSAAGLEHATGVS